MIAADEANVLHFRADLDDLRRAFHFQILDDRHRVAVGKGIAICVTDDGVRVRGFLGGRPFVRAFRADEQRPILIREG